MREGMMFCSQKHVSLRHLLQHPLCAKFLSKQYRVILGTMILPRQCPSKIMLSRKRIQKTSCRNLMMLGQPYLKHIQIEDSYYRKNVKISISCFVEDGEEFIT